MKKIFRENGLSIAMFLLFIVFTIGQGITGYWVYNKEQIEHGSTTVAYAEYLTTGHFWGTLLENWESEFLQMGLFILVAVKLRQKGSAESKKLDGEEKVDKEEVDGEGNKTERRFATAPTVRWLYKNSLSIAFFLLFLFSFVFHGIMSGKEAQQEALEHGQTPEPLLSFFLSADMWFQSFQNWQSEFLAIGSIVVLTIFLRQKGSPQSKPVDAPDSETGK